MGPGSDLLGTYAAGGGTMHAITLCAALSAGAIVHHLVGLRRARLDLDELVSRVRAALLRGELPRAIELCERERSPIAAVVLAGLVQRGARRSRAEIERAMERAAAEAAAGLERYLPVLASVTSIAPLLGVVGTVIGMIHAFGVGGAPGLDDPAAVEQGLATALVTTAWGLIVALATQPFHAYLAARASAVTRRFETAAQLLLDTLDELDAEPAPTGR
jgi:biopolymer transport protein ExbB